jgi:hypothetical protein
MKLLSRKLTPQQSSELLDKIDNHFENQGVESNRYSIQSISGLSEIKSLEDKIGQFEIEESVATPTAIIDKTCTQKFEIKFSPRSPLRSPSPPMY